jgi:hypothetical protein
MVFIFGFLLRGYCVEPRRTGRAGLQVLPLSKGGGYTP